MHKIFDIAVALELVTRKTDQLMAGRRRFRESMRGAEDGAVEGKSLLTEDECGKREVGRRVCAAEWGKGRFGIASGVCSDEGRAGNADWKGKAHI